jgi:cyclohexa-1,5-dienecarbonyl-CoA hydratase
MSADETIHIRSEGETAWVTLDRPPLNVLDIAMMHELGGALQLLLPRCNVLIFQGAGLKSFSAGAEVRDHTPERVREMLGAFHSVFRQLARSDCLTIAAVHGHCLGGGMELATFCDFVLATESAKFGQPEIKLGCFPPVAMVTLPRLVGPRSALELILTGRTISAQEARQIGLVTRLVPDGELEQAVNALLTELRGLSPAVLRMTRRALRQRDAGEFEASLAEVEDLYLNELMKSEDAREGIQAFLEKRVPVWTGR